MSDNSTIKHSETDWDYIHKMQDEDIDLSDIPELTEEDFARAVMRVSGQPVVRDKVRVNMYLDADIVAFFESKAGGREYQTLINEFLRESITSHDLEIMLRRVIREELHPA